MKRLAYQYPDDDAASTVQLCARDLSLLGMLWSLLCAGQRARCRCRLVKMGQFRVADFDILPSSRGPLDVYLFSIANAAAYNRTGGDGFNAVRGPR